MKSRYLFLMHGADEMGGAQRYQLDYFRYIDYKKYSVTFAIGRGKEVFSEYFKKDKLSVELVRCPSFQPGDGFLKKCLKYLRFFREIKPSAIVFNQFCLENFSLPELIAAFFASKGNSFMILHSFPKVCPIYKSKLHFGLLPGLGLGWRKERMQQRLLGYFVKYSIVVSTALRDSVIKRLGFPGDRVKCLHHGVDVVEFAPSPEGRRKFRQAHSISDSDILIVSTARFSARKNLDRLVNAFAMLAKEKKNVQLLFIGIGVKYNEIVSLVNSLAEDIKGRVKFLGFRDDVASILQACDIFVLTSDLEGLNIATLEALSCGLISVVTDCGGPLDIIKDGWNGFIVKKNAESVFDGLKKAIDLTENEKNVIRKNSRDFIVENFDLRKNVKFGLRLLGMDA